QDKKTGTARSCPCPGVCQVVAVLLLPAASWSFAAQLVPLVELLRRKNRFNFGGEAFADFFDLGRAIFPRKIFVIAKFAQFCRLFLEDGLELLLLVVRQFELLGDLL